MRLFEVPVARRLTAWLTIVFALLGSAALFALVAAPSGDTFPASGLPGAAESAQVAELLEEGPSADATVALLVFDRDGAELSDSDLTAVAAAASRMSRLSTAPMAVRPATSDDGRAALVTVPLSRSDVENDVTAAAEELRSAADQDLPDGLRARLTGPVGFQADISNAFAGADFRLLLVTVIVVGVLLIITYRSPLLWIVPLVAVGLADGLARVIVSALGPALGFTIDPSVAGIQSVLVFGAGTNYALLLVARYREELLREPDRFTAMRSAVRGAGSAILASGGTVALSLLLLLLGSLDGTRALGFACAIGILVALVFGLLVLPAALALCGRGLFWPFVPRYDAARDHDNRSVWARIGRGVARRPRAVIAGALALLVVLGIGAVGLRIGLPQTEQILGDPESVQAQGVLEESFDAGLGAQTVVLAPTADADRAEQLISATEGVDIVTRGDSWDDLVELDVTLAGSPQSAEAFATIEELRSSFTDGGGSLPETLVGGTDATALDVRDASERDRGLILPLIIAVVFGVLAVLLRSLVAPVVLIATVLATFFASLGASNWIFQNVLGFAAFDTSVVLFGFLFLVALGVDYNIFLVTRAREERAAGLATRDAMVRALGGTGGVITSAGILLAAVFVVLGVLPVVALAQIGVIVCIGVLLDTLLVRTVVVPAVVFVLDDVFWWPGSRR